MQVSVVVPTRGRPERVTALVDRLLEDPAVLEVVVVVDGDPATLEKLLLRAECAPRLRPLGQAHAGAGAARQRGLEASRGQVVLLLDDDVMPHTGLVSGHAAAHDRFPRSVVVGSMPTHTPGRRTADSVTTHIYVDDYEHCVADWTQDPRTILDHLWAGNVSIRREDALAVGLDDPVMGPLFFEDLDLGLRLRRAGLTGVFLPELAATHVHSRSLRRFLEDSIRQGRALRILHRRYPDTVPEPTPRCIVGRAPWPTCLLVTAAAAGGPLGRALPEGVLALTRLAGWLRLWSFQHLLAVLLRRIGQAAAAGRAW